MNSLDEKPTILGCYRFGDKIGVGAFGVVYKALDTESGDFVAIKRINVEKISKVQLRQLLTEGTLMESLSHKHIVSFYGAQETEKHINLILEYVDSGSLASIITKYGILSESLAGIYAQQVLQGLEYLHQNKVVHRDLKGNNILITMDGTVKLADFGIAMLYQSKEATAKDLGENVDIGSPYWMAPEVIQLIDASPASDIWSLGCTVIEMIEGKPPYFELNKMSVCMRMVQDEHPPFPNGISEELVDFLNKCFVKDPKNRATASELLSHTWITKASQNKESKKDKIKKSKSITALPRYKVDKGDLVITSNQKSIEKINMDLQTPMNKKPNNEVGGGYSLNKKKRGLKKKAQVANNNSPNKEEDQEKRISFNVESENKTGDDKKDNGMDIVTNTKSDEVGANKTEVNGEQEKKVENPVLTNPSLKHLNTKSSSLNAPITNGSHNGESNSHNSPKENLKSSGDLKELRKSENIHSSKLSVSTPLHQTNNSSPPTHHNNPNTTISTNSRPSVNNMMVKEHSDLPRAISLSHVEKHFGFNTRDIGRLMNNQEKRQKQDSKNTLPKNNKKTKSFSKSCQSCDTTFGVSNWRYTCRCCEGVFCKKCLTKKMAVPKISTSRPVRICLNCFNNIMLS